MALGLLATLALLAAAPAGAAVRFVVRERRRLAAPASYKYLVNLDNTGDTLQRAPADGCSPEVAGYPATCRWISIAGAASSSPVVTSGDENDSITGILDLPAGRYLVSVLADGWKLDGEHFTVAGRDGADQSWS